MPSLQLLNDIFSYHAWHELNAEQPALAAWLRGVPLQHGADVIGQGMNYAIRNGPFPLRQRAAKTC